MMFAVLGSLLAVFAFFVGVQCNEAVHRRRKSAQEEEDRDRDEQSRIWTAIEANRDKTTSLDIQVAAWMSQMDRMSVGRRK